MNICNQEGSQQYDAEQGENQGTFEHLKEVSEILTVSTWKKRSLTTVDACNL